MRLKPMYKLSLMFQVEFWFSTVTVASAFVLWLSLITTSVLVSVAPFEIFIVALPPLPIFSSWLFIQFEFGPVMLSVALPLPPIFELPVFVQLELGSVIVTVELLKNPAAMVVSRLVTVAPLLILSVALPL